VRLGAFTLAKDRVGFGKHRSGLGYEQIHSFRGSAMWGYMTGCSGSLFPSSQPLFGGYASPTYPLCKIKNTNVFDVLEKSPEKVPFDIVRLMNEQLIEGATYSTHPMAMTFELAAPGELYMMCQGAGGGYGDVLERDPALVMKDLEEKLISDDTARDIYKVAYDPASRLVDEEGTRRLRDAERKARMARGVPYDKFVRTWNTPEPPPGLPYMGCWGDDVGQIYGVMMGQRVKMEAAALQSQFMLNPKDVQIAALQAEVAALKKGAAAAAARPASKKAKPLARKAVPASKKKKTVAKKKPVAKGKPATSKRR